ncbi:hypothetical protein DM02DRAFT_678714 [Periconia macrospinosa]|uniref:Uncharacterized protein n=1 Tax=Periconia macrospinosa TaxID=97972 RepID=A0A2V1CX40_9PLEO|nr:hypothetical protein DM02DRAFT_678714 [Periconia macrospinosa]
MLILIFILRRDTFDPSLPCTITLAGLKAGDNTLTLLMDTSMARIKVFVMSSDDFPWTDMFVANLSSSSYGTRENFDSVYPNPGESVVTGRAASVDSQLRRHLEYLD